MLGYLSESFSFCSVGTLARSTRACTLFFFFFNSPTLNAPHTCVYVSLSLLTSDPSPQKLHAICNIYQSLSSSMPYSSYFSLTFLPVFYMICFRFFLSLGFPVCDNMFGLTKKSSCLSWIWFRFWLCLYVSPMRLSFSSWSYFFTYNHSLFKPTCMGSWTRTHKNLC